MVEPCASAELVSEEKADFLEHEKAQRAAKEMEETASNLAFKESHVEMMKKETIEVAYDASVAQASGHGLFFFSSDTHKCGWRTRLVA